jgi:putative peptidoglycan lipid II flippase
MLPASVGVAAFQINVLLTQLLAFGVHAPIVATFNYSVRLMEFPQGLFGVSLATYLLPTLSGHAAEKDYASFRRTLREGLSYLLFVNLLASALLVGLAEPIIRLLFEYGRFDRASTFAVAQALACLAPGLVAFSAVNIVARAFFALGDTATPMRISVFSLAVNLVLAGLLLLGLGLGAAGLGLANTLSSVMNVALLLYALRRKLARLELGPLQSSLAGALGAATIAGATAWASWHAWEVLWGHGSVALRAGAVFIPMILATAVYGAISAWAGVPAMREVWRTLRSRGATRG